MNDDGEAVMMGGVVDVRDDKEDAMMKRDGGFVEMEDEEGIDEAKEGESGVVVGGEEDIGSGLSGRG